MTEKNGIGFVEREIGSVHRNEESSVYSKVLLITPEVDVESERRTL